MITALLLMLVAGELPVEQMKQNTVFIITVSKIEDKKMESHGTGLVVGERQVVTNWHVCCSSDTVPEGVNVQTTLVILPSKEKETWQRAKVLWKSLDKDLAVLETEKPLQRPVVVFSERKLLREGQPVWAVGFPGASNRIADGDSDFIPTITQGIISRFMTGHTRQGSASTRLVQSTAAVNPGNSGGPLFDECGNVIGVNRAKALATVLNGEGKTTRVTEADGINWAVQTDELLPELQKLNVKYTLVNKSCSAAAVLSGSPFSMPPWMLAGQVGTALVALTAVFLAANRRTREAIVKATTRRREEPRVMAAAAAGAAGATPGAPAVAARKPVTLQGVGGFYNGASIPIEDRPVVFGRDFNAANLVYPDEMAQISKRHCQVTFDAASGGASVEDLWSSNGTFLDSGVRLDPGKPYAVRAGQGFYLGSPENSFIVKGA